MRCLVRSAVLLLLGLFLLSGCTRVRALWVAPYERGREVTIRPAPETGVYKVKWSRERDGRSFGLDESARIVKAGDPIGFGTDPDGRVFALAGEYEMPLDGLQPDARFWVWSYKLEEPTGLARSMQALGPLEFDAAEITGMVLDAAIDSLVDDDDDNKEDDDGVRPKDRGERYRRKSDRDDPRVRVKHD